MMVIVGKTVRLRPMEKRDLELKVRWINDPDVNAKLHYDVPITLAKTQEWFERVSQDATRHDSVIELLDATPVGLIGLMKIEQRDRTAEIYIAIGEKEYWGKGVMLESEGLLIKWAFEQLGLHKIWAQTRATNVASIITMKKLGFRIEGTLREEKEVAGKRVDIIRVGLLRHEFDSQLLEDKA